jgi:hypothetical protein
MMDAEGSREDLRAIHASEKRRLKLGKRLAYILRYGAEKEGCQVDGGIPLTQVSIVFLIICYFRLDSTGRIDESLIAQRVSHRRGAG